MEKNMSDSFTRTSSEATLTSNDQTVNKWERSQSEMKLSKGSSMEKIGGKSVAGNVSEHSSVYWDLSKAVDEQAGSKSSSSGKVKISLQTIKQKEELNQSSAPSTAPIQSQRRGSLVKVQHYYTKRSSSETICPPVVTSTATHSISSSKQVVNDTPLEPPPLTNVCPLPPQPPTLHSQLEAGTKLLKKNIVLLSLESVPMQCSALREILQAIEDAWATPHYGRDLATGLCKVLNNEGGLDIIICNCGSVTYDVRLGSAQVLEQSMIVENRDSIVEKGLDIVVTMSRTNQNDHLMTKASTGILENLFKHSQQTCGRVIHLGGLQVILQACRTSDKTTLRHCANALANLAMYGGPENQHEMIKSNAADWLFPLAFSDDDSIRYYACLAITTLSANKEMEAAVEKSGTLDLVEPFVLTHSPSQFAKSDNAHMHGRAKDWLERLVPVLSSKRKEAQSLAAFHFAMEAGIKAEQDRKEVHPGGMREHPVVNQIREIWTKGRFTYYIKVFKEINAIKPLKSLAASPNTLAAKFAAEALRVIGEEVPYCLSPQVPTWTVKDVQHWIEQIGFGEYSSAFSKYQVDGDLLLRMTEQSLNNDIQMTNGITRMRFMRELTYLKQTTDYKSCDHTSLNDFIRSVNKDLTKYTYQMLRSGVDKNMLSLITEEHLRVDCMIDNGVDRLKILQAIRGNAVKCSSLRSSIDLTDSELPRSIDCFISYRRSNGSQLASLLKVHLALRGFSVFLDIEKLRAGKFDESLLNSVNNARHFILVLTPNSLDRCIGDNMNKDWVHREIVAAISSGCNIIPVMDSFDWPNPEQLPQDMRAVVRFNGIRWIHDYQDACVDKLEKFLIGERSPTGNLGLLSPDTTVSDIHGYGPMFGKTSLTSSEKSSPDNADALPY